MSKLIYIDLNAYVNGIINWKSVWKCRKEFKSVYSELQLIRSSVEKRNFLLKNFTLTIRQKKMREKREIAYMNVSMFFNSSGYHVKCTTYTWVCVSRWNLSSMLLISSLKSERMISKTTYVELIIICFSVCECARRADERVFLHTTDSIWSGASFNKHMEIMRKSKNKIQPKVFAPNVG